MTLIEIRHLLLIVTIFIQSTTQAQDCRVIRRLTKKSSEIHVKGASAESIDLLLLYLEKNFDPKNPNDTINYSAMIIMGSRYVLEDSLINAAGKFEFHLSNGETSTWGNAKASNLGDVLMSPYTNTVMFQVQGTKRQLEPLTKHNILKIRVFEILETDFDTKSQKQLLKIANCLIQSDDQW